MMVVTIMVGVGDDGPETNLFTNKTILPPPKKNELVTQNYTKIDIFSL